MKRFFVLLASLVFMLTYSSALAIEFHGIPWGISVNELESSLEERGIVVNADDIKNDASMPVWSYTFRNSFMNNIESTGYQISLYYYSAYDEKPSIAGYPVKEMQFYSHYDIDDGVLSQEADDSHYYMAQIGFDVSDERTPAIYDDLYNKLTGLYGEGVENSTFEVETTYTYTVWEGMDNTAVCLYRSESTSSDYQFLNLWYGNTTIEETLLNVRKLVVEKQIQLQVQAAANDTTGL